MRHITASAVSTLLVATLASAAPEQSNQAAQQQEPRARLGSEETNAERKIHLDTRVTPTSRATAEDRRALSFAAGRILVHVDRARDALKQNNRQAATEQLNRALTLVDIINRTAPEYRVETTMRAGDLEYRDDSTVKPLLLPIYTELERVSVLGPVIRAKNESGDEFTADQASAANKKGSGTSMSQMMPIVEDVAIGATSVELDVDLAAKHLRVAKEHLDANRLREANAAMRAVQQGVILTYAETDAPLLEARQNLYLAASYAEEGDPQSARAALQRANAALESFGRQNAGGRAAETEQLRSQLSSLTDDLAKESEAKLPEVARTIRELWNRVTEVTS